MNLVELDHALRQLRLSGMAAVLETRLRQAQTEKLTPIDLVSTLVADELLRRQDRLLERRHKHARFRDPDRTLDTFDFDFNKKMNRALIHDLATARFIAQREDVLVSRSAGHGQESSRPSHRPRRHPAGLPRRSTARRTSCSRNSRTRRSMARARTYIADLATVPLLIIDDLGMRKLPHTGRRRSLGDHHAALRARLDAADVESAGR